MKEIILIKNGEIVLKGLNRSTFEDVLIKNLRHAIKPYGSAVIKKRSLPYTLSRRTALTLTARSKR